ncbi:MAG: M3 family oligoendopeptidase [Oscillospiraceae bacterium]|nr:M3 family oligoendopeptidase [Oscillospiraceae bacterium]
MKFSEMTYTRPDLQKVLAECADCAEKIRRADTPEKLVELYREENKIMDHYRTAAILAEIHYTQDTRDPFWSAEQDWFDSNGPAVANADVLIAKAILENPHADVLEKTFGSRVLPTLKNKVLSMDERVLELQKEENALSSAYQKLYGAALVELDGKQLTIPQLTLYKESTDPAVRRKAYEAEASYFDAHRAEFDEIYDKMIKNRNEQAHILGYHDYSELSYVRMNRIGYGPKEVAAFREEVVEQVVPMLEKLMKLRNRRTGIEHPMFWDSTFYFADGNPVPHGSYEELMAGARTMYHELSPETAEFIDFMQDNEMFDVLSRPGKMGGGYEEIIPDYKAPFIFANWNGTSGDVDVLTHEAGHAFESYLAAKDPSDIPGELQCPGMESAEIHSMSMEFLTEPWHHLFFKEDTAKYELYHTEDSFFFLPYGCMVDEFQHIMYQNPDLTPDERNAEWLKLEKKYRPWNDFGDLPMYSRGAGWQRQLHIFECPFYYIDYCLASVIALQFFVAQLKNPKDAWERYLRMTRLAGTATYTEMAECAGMKVPFTKGSLTDLARTVADWIEHNQI